MATEHANELSALREQVLAVLPHLDTGGPVDQFPSEVRVTLRSQPPNPQLVGVVRALVAAIGAIDAYLHS